MMTIRTDAKPLGFNSKSLKSEQDVPHPPKAEPPTQGTHHQLLIKGAIVFLVFPVLSSVVSMLAGLTLSLPLLLFPEPVQLSILRSLSIAAQLIGLVGSFLICRHAWPKRESIAHSD